MICYCYTYYLLTRINTPFDGYKLDAILPHHTWGTFRSGHYFGLKTAAPSSVVTGLMWFENRIEGNSIPIRHWCDQNDRLHKYTWIKHDFKNFGVQEIHDGNWTIQTSFVKTNEKEWKARISAKLKSNQNITFPLSFILYAAKENTRDRIEHLPFDNSKPNSTFKIHGSSVVLNDFEISFTVTKGEPNVLQKSYLSTMSQPALVYLKETILNHLYQCTVKDLGPHKHLFVIKNDDAHKEDINFIAHQIIIDESVEIEMDFKLKNSTQHENQDANSYETQLNKNIQNFDNEFEQKFGLLNKNYSLKQINFAKEVISNMLGSIGYFYGYSEVQSKHTPNPVLYGPLQLLTAVPSRSFFPRGFLWDEGFHQLLINNWNLDLSLKIIKSWFNLMNSEGWIPREVILGNEARARVPSEFIVQKNTNANPPTLFLALETIIKREEFNDLNFLKEIFPRLEVWFDWFNNSQVGLYPSTYRWRGRDAKTKRELNPQTLTSGLDDYPRATNPTDEEIHLDIRCWIAFAAKVMAKIAFLLKHPSEIKYKQTADYLHDNNLLDKIHWSEKYQHYCDKGLHSTQVKLVKKKDKNNPEIEYMEREFIVPPKYDFVPDFGYVSLFPLILEIINPDNPKLGKILDDLENPQLLWNPYGIRSLSKTSNYYQQYNTDVDAPYWRGTIWINFNYLILKSLHHYSSITGPYQSRSLRIYKNLRDNLVSNLFTEYVRSGYIWEQYNDTTGRGRGSHPFTGWSALIVLIMTEEY